MPKTGASASVREFTQSITAEERSAMAKNKAGTATRAERALAGKVGVRQLEARGTVEARPARPGATAAGRRKAAGIKKAAQTRAAKRAPAATKTAKKAKTTTKAATVRAAVRKRG